MSVRELTADIKLLLEQSFTDLWVVGEVSNFSRPSSGHCYFTLKDDDAQIRAVMWRGTASRMKFDLTDGMQLVCRGRIDVYPPRGSYQLVVEKAQPKGVGALELALRQLREKLGAEGLFDAERKRALPSFPRRVAFVTSPTGAAVRDFLEVARRRWEGMQIFILPAKVQGEGAAAEIAAGIRLANKLRPKLDALVVGRGGGSVEDLWCFNEEPVIRAIAASRVPTVSAVGHEIDITLADLAADVRALTPSEAAERVVPSAEEVLRHISTFESRLTGNLRRRIELHRSKLQLIANGRPFARPFAAVQDLARRLDLLEASASRSVGGVIDERRRQLATLAGKAESLSPLAVLGRGYSLVMNQRGKLIRRTTEVSPGDPIEVRLVDGSVEAEVK